MNKEPPDKIKTVKYRLDQLIRNEENTQILFDACNRCNKLVICTYQFLRLWILSKYYNKTCDFQKITKITKEMIKKAMGVLVKDKKQSIKNTKGKNKVIKEEFINFYNSTFCKLDNSEKVDGTNLSNIIDILAGNQKVLYLVINISPNIIILTIYILFLQY